MSVGGLKQRSIGDDEGWATHLRTRPQQDAATREWGTRELCSQSNPEFEFWKSFTPLHLTNVSQWAVRFGEDWGVSMRVGVTRPVGYPSLGGPHLEGPISWVPRERPHWQIGYTHASGLFVAIWSIRGTIYTYIVYVGNRGRNQGGLELHMKVNNCSSQLGVFSFVFFREEKKNSLVLRKESNWSFH